MSKIDKKDIQKKFQRHEGDAVGVRIFDTEQKAALQHQAGLMRLFQLQLRKECTYLVKNMPQSAAADRGMRSDRTRAKRQFPP